VRAAACVISARSRRSSTGASATRAPSWSTTPSSRSFYSTILALKVGSQQQAAVLKDVQRHPYKNQIVHIDFQRVLEDEKIRMQVPLHFKGGAESKGVKEQGGVLSHVRNDVEVVCLPKDLPEYVEVDVSGLEINQVVKLSDLKLPPGVELVDLLARRDGPVASIHMPRVEEEAPVVEEAAAVAAAPGAAPAAGAPAAPGAAPAAGAAAPAAADAKGGKDAKDAKKGDAKK
jgi:large subunit ribosomal protein L25